MSHTWPCKDNADHCEAIQPISKVCIQVSCQLFLFNIYIINKYLKCMHFAILFGSQCIGRLLLFKIPFSPPLSFFLQFPFPFFILDIINLNIYGIQRLHSLSHLDFLHGVSSRSLFSHHLPPSPTPFIWKSGHLRFLHPSHLTVCCNHIRVMEYSTTEFILFPVPHSVIDLDGQQINSNNLRPYLSSAFCLCKSGTCTVDGITFRTQSCTFRNFNTCSIGFNTW